jgi:4-hydroxy-tetrahydrodipicolinate synthase
MKDLSGVLTALVTPFRDGQVDFDSLKKLVRFQLDRGVRGFIVSGTTGESPTLTAGEKRKIFEFVRGESGNSVPVVVGTGTNSTADSIVATQEAATWGADAALVVVPYYNKPPQRGLYQHFKAVAECSKLPVLLYNVPGRTITKLDLETIIELSRVPNVIGIKEATGDIEFGKKIIAGCSKSFLVLSGDDGTYLDLALVGGQGVISVASHIFPKEFSQWYERAHRGDTAVREEFTRIADLNLYLYVEANPIPIKMALYLMGLIASPELRLPLVRMADHLTVDLKAKMIAAGLL